MLKWTTTTTTTAVFIKRVVCFSLSDSQLAGVRFAGDETRTVRLRVRRTVRRPLVPHAMAVQTLLPARRQDQGPAVVSAERVALPFERHAREYVYRVYSTYGRTSV